MTFLGCVIIITTTIATIATIVYYHLLQIPGLQTYSENVHHRIGAPFVVRLIFRIFALERLTSGKRRVSLTRTSSYRKRFLVATYGDCAMEGDGEYDGPSICFAAAGWLKVWYYGVGMYFFICFGNI
tara:strand:- start:29 stop:409 length:381 start_codon:yes stop_codon:yes gene_type:complete